jgi:hypothetical protein
MRAVPSERQKGRDGKDMTWKARWQVVCERCGSEAMCDYHWKGKEHSKLPAGWICEYFYLDDHHLCPECNDQRRPDWWPAKRPK